MLRLTPSLPAQKGRAYRLVLKVEGWINAPDLPWFEAELRHWLAETDVLVLDLEGVLSIDRAGLALLQQYAGEHLCLENGSPYLRQLLSISNPYKEE